MAVDFKLYLITDRHASTLPLPQAVRLALEGGVRAIQLREKDLPIREFLALAQELRIITREFGAKLFVNDRIDVAVAVGADGVHLGTQSIPASAARKVVGKDMLIGVSTHGMEEAKMAHAWGGDFITFGPLFSTPSKTRYGPPVGLEAMRGVKSVVKLPVFGIGGIKSGNVGRVIEAGADGIAMISAILAADDIRKAAEEVLAQIDQK